MKKWLNRSGHFLFWSWNSIFFVFIYLGILPFTGPDLIFGLLHDTMNIDIMAFFVVVLFLPALAAILGWWKFRRNPLALVKILYGIELPLLLLTLFRIFFLRECTVGVIHILLVFSLASFFLMWALFRQDSDKNRWIVLGGNTILLWCGIWIFLFLIFLIPPSAWNTVLAFGEFLSGIFANLIRMDFYLFPGFFFFVLGSLFFFFTATLFVFLPCAYVFFACRTWLESWRAFASPKYKWSAAMLTGFILFSNTACFWVINNQHHVETFQQLDGMNGGREEKIKLLQNKEEIRKGLVNIYLAPYRYMGEWEKVNAIQSLYAKTFAMKPESARWIQDLFNYVARPLIYRGTGKGMAADQKEAERLYTQFFDAPIQEAERAPLQHAMQATYSREQRDAGLINIDQKKVHLAAQQVTIVEHGETADLEIKETYVNKYSHQPEEVFYHLTLPEGAVVTGLWLSDTDTKKYAYRVASRGAAQKVYKEIIRQSNDPALVEQVGPRMYRLRIFPIPAVNPYKRDEIQKMNMWLNIKMLRQSDSEWELPQVTEKRNVYWDEDTEYRLNGRKQDKSSSWLPEHLPCLTASQASPHSVQIGKYGITALPMSRFPFNKTLPLKIAVLLESSYSMGKHRDSLVQLGRQFDTNATGHTFDYFCMDSTIKKIPSLDATVFDSLTFFGSLGTSVVLKTFFGSEYGEDYDQVLVLTDKSLFMEKEKEEKDKLLNRPTWFLLVDGQYPRVAGDALMQEIYSVGGGIENELSVVLERIRLHQQARNNRKIIGFDQRYLWTISEEVDGNMPESDLVVFAASRLIQHLSSLGEPLSLVEMTKNHQIALQNGIVTPFSSMIVLVNDFQQKLLEKAEQGGERFERQVETGKEILSTPQSPLEVSAVPEPEEWLLIIVVLGFLTNHLYRRRKHIVPGFGLF